MNILKFTKVNILSIIYSITYCEHESEVDIEKKYPSKGQICDKTKTIRIHKNSSKEDILKTLLHEIIHGIITEFGIQNLIKDEKEAENITEFLANGLTDTLIRNKLITLE